MDLAELREIGEKERTAQKPIRVHCCTSTGCQAANSLAVKKNLEQTCKQKQMGDRVQVVGVGCMEFCGRGPLVQIEAQNKLYEEVTPSDAASIIEAIDGGTATAKEGDPEHPFFARQMRIVRETSGKIDPERIEEYIAFGGYEPLYKAIHDLTPTETIDEVSKSGLRGRGGGGYPTGLKWATVAKMPGQQ
ncbi:MAG: NAD(P)H-dependent oxidoreductase subunit E, partial [Chroococcales cyanobacterium]